MKLDLGILQKTKFFCQAKLGVEGLAWFRKIAIERFFRQIFENTDATWFYGSRTLTFSHPLESGIFNLRQFIIFSTRQFHLLTECLFFGG
jgi:hypothetical protein